MGADSTQAIAVLPFVNLNQDPKWDYLSDGLTESILYALAQLPGLRVTARTSAFAYKDKALHVRQIGQELGVDILIEGSVLLEGPQVRIQVRQVNAQSGFEVWSKQFERSKAALFRWQTEIAATIAKQMQKPAGVRPAAPDLDHLSAEAYVHFLQGKYYWNRWTPEDVKQAIRLFKQTLELAPDFALPYAHMASCYTMLATHGQIPQAEGLEQAARAAEKALELDPTSAVAFMSLAYVRMVHNLDWVEAGRLMQEALRINPGLAEVHHYYGWYLYGNGYFEAAISHLEHALQLDPLSLPIHQSLGDAYRYAGNLEAAAARYQQAIDLAPDFRSVWEALGGTQAQMGQHELAVQTLKHYGKLVGNPQKGLTMLAYTYSLMGKTAEVEHLLSIMQARQLTEPDISLSADLCIIYLGLGEEEKAMDFLEQAFHNRMGIIFFVKDPILAPLRKFNRYKELLASIHMAGAPGPKQSPRHLPLQNDLLIQGDTQVQLRIPRQDFLYAEAQTNYCRIFWRSSSGLQHKLIRLSMKHLVDQISDPKIVRCHRSFLVNLALPLRLRGNARGYKLVSKAPAFEVPISRKLAPTLINRHFSHTLEQ